MADRRTTRKGPPHRHGLRRTRLPAPLSWRATAADAQRAAAKIPFAMSVNRDEPALVPHLRSDRADSTKPLTATSNPRTYLHLFDGAHPSDPSSPGQSAGFRAERIGGPILGDFANGAFGNQSQGSSIDRSRKVSILDLLGRSTGRNDQRDSTFPGGKCGRAAGAQFPPFLRVSGTLRNDPPSGNFSTQPQPKNHYAP